MDFQKISSLYYVKAKVSNKAIMIIDILQRFGGFSND